VSLSARVEQLLREVSVQILEAQRPIRVLRVLAWDESVERAFFASGGEVPPQPTYQVPVPEIERSLERFRELKLLVGGDNGIERFLRDTCESFATAARMLLAVGTKDFYFHACEIYGRPGSLSSDRKTTNLDLAQHFARIVDSVAGHVRLTSAIDDEVWSAEEAAPELQRRFALTFPDRNVRVEIVEQFGHRGGLRAGDVWDVVARLRGQVGDGAGDGGDMPGELAEGRRFLVRLPRHEVLGDASEDAAGGGGFLAQLGGEGFGDGHHCTPFGSIHITSQWWPSRS